MCDNWMDKYFDNKSFCSGVINKNKEGEYVISGTLNNNSINKNIFYYAPNSPTYCSSYSGSGLPYSSPSVAFEDTPNKGVVTTTDGGNFTFKIRYPNSYYVGIGTNYIEPHIFIKLCGSKNVYTMKLGDGIPFRLLTYPSPPALAPRKNPLFYYNKDGTHPLRSQEQILRDSGYPSKNKMPDNFWGKAIPH